MHKLCCIPNNLGLVERVHVKGKLGIIPKFVLGHNVFVTWLIFLILLYGIHEDVTTLHNWADASYGGVNINRNYTPYKPIQDFFK